MVGPIGDVGGRHGQRRAPEELGGAPGAALARHGAGRALTPALAAQRCLHHMPRRLGSRQKGRGARWSPRASTLTF